MKPASSSARTRRRQGGAEMPTRRDSSTLVMRPSSCSSFRIFQSMASRRAGTGELRAAGSEGRRPAYYSYPNRRPGETILRTTDSRRYELLIHAGMIGRGLQNLHGCYERIHRLPIRPGDRRARCRFCSHSESEPMPKTTHAKVVIIGSGPAGYTAAIYAARAMLQPVLLQGIQPGGQLTITTDVENYPGFADVIQGPWLMEQMQKQAAHVGTRLIADHVTSLDLSRRPFRLVCDSGDIYLADSVILATGAQARWLDLPSEQKFKGYGVSACATCDGFFYRGKEVIVVGGGYTAVEEALFLTNFADKVTVVHRRDAFRAEKILQERLFKNPKISVLWDTVLEDVRGDENPLKVKSVVLRNLKTGAASERRIDGVFIAIGHTPATELVAGQLEMKPNGYVLTAPYSTATSVSGVFAAGDVT